MGVEVARDGRVGCVVWVYVGGVGVGSGVNVGKDRVGGGRDKVGWEM